jgi:hypothetical protein
MPKQFLFLLILPGNISMMVPIRILYGVLFLLMMLHGKQDQVNWGMEMVMKQPLLDMGVIASNKYITTWFRKTVTINGKNNYNSFIAKYKVDDGIVIYVNGVEVKREKMPTGIITYKTLASGKASDDGTLIHTANIADKSFCRRRQCYCCRSASNRC